MFIPILAIALIAAAGGIASGTLAGCAAGVVFAMAVLGCLQLARRVVRANVAAETELLLGELRDLLVNE